MRGGPRAPRSRDETRDGIHDDTIVEPVWDKFVRQEDWEVLSKLFGFRSPIECQAFALHGNIGLAYAKELEIQHHQKRLRRR